MEKLYAKDKCLLRKVMLATGDDMEPAKNRALPCPEIGLKWF